MSTVNPGLPLEAIGGTRPDQAQALAAAEAMNNPAARIQQQMELQKEFGHSELQPAPTTGQPAAGTRNIAAEKYGDDVNKTQQGYNELFGHLNTMKTELQQERERRQVFEQELMARMQSGNPAPAPKSAFDELKEFGLPEDLLRRAQQEVAREAVREELQPLLSAAAAQQQLNSKHPDFQTHAPKVHEFLNTHPELNNYFQRVSSIGPEGAVMAYEWALDRYREANGGGPVASSTPEPSPNAAPPTSGGMTARNTGTEPDLEKEMRAIQYARQTGDLRAPARVFFQNRPQQIHPDFQQPKE